MSTELDVYLDRYGSYQLVGTLVAGTTEGAVSRFAYAPSYLGDPASRPISCRFPLQQEAYSGESVRTWFGALLPEGQSARAIAELFGVEVDDYAATLAYLRDETMGALVFCAPGSMPGEEESYQVLPQDFLSRLAEHPRLVARETLGTARLSLAGEMTKVGLYYDEARSEWLLPMGAAPSTHVVKACTGEFELQTLNEALCMRAAELCDVAVPETRLVDTGFGEPLLISRRFDRPIPDEPLLVGGHARPKRLHQEDFCQALGIPGFLKYEPTGADFLGNMARCIDRMCANSFGERVVLFEAVALSFLLGNCDNHLKNYALLYSEELHGCELSPVYDITSTTLYPELSREMGVALTMSRSIDDVSRTDIESSCRRAGVGRVIGMQVFDELRAALPGALETARDEMVAQGFPQAGMVADKLLLDAATRIARTAS